MLTLFKMGLFGGYSQMGGGGGEAVSLKRLILQWWNFAQLYSRDDTHMTYMEIVQFVRLPLSIYVRNSSTPLTLDIQFQTNHPLLQMMTNQLKEKLIQGWVLNVINKVTIELFIFFIDYYWHLIEWGIGQGICDG